MTELHFLYIEPEQTATEPVDDEITAFMKVMMTLAAHHKDKLRVQHCCDCNKRPNSTQYIMPNGMVTHSLAVHYLQVHRSEIPAHEMRNVKLVMEECREAYDRFKTKQEQTNVQRRSDENES